MSATRCATVTLALLTACAPMSRLDGPLPSPVQPPFGDVIACVDSAPPPVLVASRPTDPSACLSAEARARGLAVTVDVTRSGRPTGVRPTVFLCIEVGPDGSELPPLTLSDAEARCVLAQMGSWHFATLDTCAPQHAEVTLGDAGALEAALTGRVHWDDRGRRTTGCS